MLVRDKVADLSGRGLRRRSAAARLVGLRLRIPSETLMSVSCECCMLSENSADHSYRGVIPIVVCVSDVEASIIGKPWHTSGCRTMEKRQIK
jgi:hypothetical protein